MLYFHTFLISLAFMLMCLPTALSAQSNECLERGEGWFTVPDEALSPFLGDFSYRIDGEVVVEGDDLALALFSGDYTHTIFWDERFLEQNPDPLMMLQVYSGVSGVAVFLGEISLSDDSPEDVYLSDIIKGGGEYFFVVFQKELPTKHVVSEDDIPSNSGGDMVIPPGTVIDIGDIPIAEGGPTPNEINEYGHLWYQQYFETHTLLWCGAESDDTSSVPLLPWNIISFSVSIFSETTPPTLSYATSTPYEGNGMYPNKAVADEDELTFAVVYTDAENDAPEYVRAWVNDDEGTDIFFDMTAASESEAGAVAPASLTDGNYQNGELFTATSTFPKGEYVYTFLTKESAEEAEEQSFPTQTPEDSSISFQTGYSSVAFLPGIGGSRLYTERGNGEMVWEPNDLADIEQVAVDPNTGTSIDSNIAVKGLTDEILLRLDAWPTTNVYKSFMEYMDEQVVGEGMIHEWKPLAYDWRLGFDKLLSHGNLIGTDDGVDVVVFSETADTPYLISELERMAQDSDSGKVTILTHSNGGLLAKYLLAHLEAENSPLLDSIDDVILVASPQLGTPEAATTLLHGTSKFGKGKERDTAEDMESAYHLLPSPTYFETVSDPIFLFSEEVDEIPELIDFVGEIIGGSGAYTAFIDFLTGHDGTWSEPTDVDAPNVLHDSHIAYAERVHGVIDSWTPLEHIDVIQIAGFGLDTTYAIQYDDCDIPFCEDSLETLDRKLLKTEHGDGTVVLASAIAMAGVDGAETYYVNIDKYNNEGSILTFDENRNRKHASILEIENLKNFLRNIFVGNSIQEDFISTQVPVSEEKSMFHFTMHSPVNIHAYVGDLHTGIIEVPGSNLRYYEEEIPNSSYSEWSESKEIIIPHGEEVLLSLEGYDEGTFTLEIEEREGDETLAYAVFTDVPVREGSASEITLTSAEDVTELAIDNDGDGTFDLIALSDETKEMVSYDTLRTELENILKQTKKMLKKQVKTAEELHNRGNVIAAKTTLKFVEKTIMRLDCAKAKKTWQKKRCIESEDVVRINAIIGVLLEQLEEPVQERKEEVKDKAKSWLEKMKETLRKR